MNWLKELFFCDTWGEFFFVALVGAVGAVVVWALIFMTIILFG